MLYIEKIKRPHLSYPLFLVILLLFLCASCERQGFHPVEKNFILMDTFVTIRVYDKDLPNSKIHKAIERARQEMVKIDSLTSFYKNDSELFQLNEHAGKGCQIVSPLLFEIILKAYNISEMTDGSYDVTIGPLMTAWGFGQKENMVVPEQSIIDSLVQHIDYHAVDFEEQGVDIADSLARIDLGGIAKGFAVDAAIEALYKAGVRDAQVDAGGDLRTIASELTMGQRNIYVRHPKDRNGFYGRFSMDEGAVATSGDYERFFVEDSVKYHHILDPKTGYPARECVSVTIQGPGTALCDALSTAIFILGPDEGLQTLEQIKDVEGIIIYERNGVLLHKLSSGLKGLFKPASEW